MIGNVTAIAPHPVNVGSLPNKSLEPTGISVPLIDNLRLAQSSAGGSAPAFGGLFSFGAASSETQ